MRGDGLLTLRSTRICVEKRCARKMCHVDGRSRQTPTPRSVHEGGVSNGARGEAGAPVLTGVLLLALALDHAGVAGRECEA